MDVADAALIQSITSGYGRFDQHTDPRALEKLASSSSDQQFREAAAEMLMSMGERSVYVSEERQHMNGWVPPPESEPIPR